MQRFQKEKKAVKKLQNLLILICRIVAITFLVFAFSQPYKNPTNGLQNAQETIISIFIDNSFSMSAKGTEGELLSESKEAAKQLINSYPNNQRYIISTNALSAVQQRIIDAKSAYEEIDLIKYSPIQRNFNSIFNWMQETMQKIDKRDQKPKSYELLFLSDFQSEFFKLDAIQADSISNINLWQFKPQKVENCYIDSLWFKNKTHRASEENELFFRLNNDSPEDIVNLELTITVNDFSKDIFMSVNGNSNSVNSVNIPVQPEGNSEGKIELRDQMMYWDDEFFFSYQTTANREILIINGKDANDRVAKVYGTEPYFDVKETPISKVNQSSFYNKRLIILNGISTISTGLSADILKFKQNGGNILILPSDDIDTRALNQLFADLGLPEVKASQKTALKANSIELRDPTFDGVFEKNEQTDLNLPNFRFIHKTNSKNTSAIALIKLRDESPVFYRSLDQQSFALYSSLKESCSDLVQNTLFPVLCIRIAEMAGSDNIPYHFIGQDKLISFETDVANNGPVKLQNNRTDFIPKTIQKDAYNYIDISGIEAMEYLSQGNFALKQMDTLKMLALNFNRKESSVKLTTTEEMTKKLALKGISSLNSQLFDEKTDVAKIKLNHIKEYWRICIFITIMAIFCEILIAKFWKNKS
tara:strand:+ start:472 stop:2409 length:1938 start_codon:yes stop_codon:yes gene_type:complete